MSTYIQAPLLNKFSRGKTISITYSECVSVALVIQYAVRVRGVVLFSVACLVLSYFSHYLINGTSFWKKVFKQNCVFVVCTTFESFPTLRTIERDVTVNLQRLSCEVLAIPGC